MQSRTFRFLLLACFLLIGLIIFQTDKKAEAADRSINGFSKNQCTWYVDRKTADVGWRLNFSGSKGDAYKWYKKGYIKNAAHGTIGKIGDIMVFGSGNDSKGKDYSKGHHGHVAHVISTGFWKGYRAWTIRHSNWGKGFGQWVVPDESKKYGATVTQCTFVEYKPNWVKIQSGNSLGETGYPLLGFLYKK